MGYFCSGIVESRPDSLVFTRTVTWAKAAEKTAQPAPKAGKKPGAERAPRERSASKGGTRSEGTMEIVECRGLRQVSDPARWPPSWTR